MNDLAPPLLGMSFRQPPANVQAEQALLGAILSNNRALQDVAEFLKPEHFADALYGRIYGEAAKRVLRGSVVDAQLLRPWLANDPEVSGDGGAGECLAGLMVAMVGIRNAREYGRAIYECWQRRELIATGERMVNDAFAGTESDVALLVAQVTDTLDGVVATGTTERKAVSMDQALDQAVSRMERAAQAEGVSGLSTGMRTVDEALGGLEPQCLYVLAGRPGMGKSALGWDWAVHVARGARDERLAGNAKAPGVLMVSLEMSAEQLARRTLSAMAGVPLQAIKEGRLNQPDTDRVIRARVELSGLPLSIEDCSGLSMGLIRLKARAARHRHGLRLIVVDHLHIVRPEDADARNGSTWAIGKISNALKQLAKEFEVPVLALAQLNRGLESRDDKRPTLADLRQAGEIEQDADAVMFVYRAEYYLPKGAPEQHKGETQAAFADRCTLLELKRAAVKGKAELILEKVRDGSPCSIELNFAGSMTRFSEPEP